MIGIPLTFSSKTFGPFFQCRLGFVNIAAAYGKTLCDVCALCCAPNIVYSVCKSAALVGAERVDRLARKIEAIEEGIDRHRHRSPVVRVAEIYLVILIDIIGQVNDLGTGVRFKVVLRLSYAFVVIIGIRLCLFDLILIFKLKAYKKSSKSS